MSLIHCYSGCFVGKNQVYTRFTDAKETLFPTLFSRQNNLSSNDNDNIPPPLTLLP